VPSTDRTQTFEPGEVSYVIVVEDGKSWRFALDSEGTRTIGRAEG